MITNKDIDEAIRFGIDRNIYKDAKELTERYLMDRLGLSLAMQTNLEKRDPQNKTYSCGFIPGDLRKYLYESTVTHTHFSINAVKRMLSEIATDAEKNDIEIKYSILPNGVYVASFTKTK